MELDPQITGFLILLANAAGTIITLKVKAIKAKADAQTKEACDEKRKARAVIASARKIFADKTVTAAESKVFLQTIDELEASMARDA